MITTAYKFEANVKDVIKLKEEFAKVKKELDGLTASTQKYKEASKNLKGIGTNLDKAKVAAEGTNKATQQLNKSGGNLINTFKSAAVAIMAAFAFRAIIGGLKSIVTSFKDFENQMAAVQAISGATNEEFQELEASAMAYGKTTVFTATQVAQLQEEFARLGFSAEEIIKVTKATLNLSAATGESLASSAQIAGATLRAFGLDAESTGEVTDTMAASFTNSALNLERFTESMKFVAPVARSTGFSLQETTAILANLADNGIKGSIAGNALKNIMLKLADSNSKLSKAVGGPVVGIKQLSEALEVLKEKGFSATEASEMLGQRAAPAFLALINNIQGLEESVDILNNAEGAAQRMAAIRLDTLQGDMTLLKSASEGLSLALGEEFDVSLRNIVYSLTRFLQGVSGSEFALWAIKTTLKLVTVALGGFMTKLAVQGLISFGQGLKNMATSISMALVPSLRSATVAQQGLNTAMRMNPWVAAISLLGTLATAFFVLGEEMTEVEMKQERLNDVMAEEIEMALDMGETSQERVDKMKELKEIIGDLTKEIDVELLSNKDLLEVRQALNDTAGHRMRLAQLKEENKAYMEATDSEKVEAMNWLKRWESAHEENIKTWQKMLDDNESIAPHITMGMIEQAREELHANRMIVDGNFHLQEEIEQMIENHYRSLGFFQDHKLGRDETFRKKTRDGLLEELEVFRLMTEGQQKYADDFEKEILETGWLVEYGQLMERMNETTGRTLKELMVQFDELVLEANEGGVDLQAKYVTMTDDDRKKLAITLELMKSFQERFRVIITGVSEDIVKMDKVLGRSLRKTKDLSKQLLKELAEGYSNAITKQQVQASMEFKQKMNSIQEEKNLITANLQEIADVREMHSALEIAALLQKNKKKFKFLEELSGEQLATMNVTQEQINEMSETQQAEHYDALLKIMDDFAHTQISKFIEAEQLEGVTRANFNKASQEEINASLAENELSKNVAAQRELNNAKKHEFNIFKNYQKNIDLRAAAAQLAADEVTRVEEQDLLDNQIAYDKKEITYAQFEAEKTRIKLQAEADRQEISRDADEQDLAQLQQTIAQISQYYQMASDAFFTFMNNRMELRKEEINQEFSQDQEIMNDQMEAELELAEGNEAQQDNIRKHYEEKAIAREEQKNEELRKIAKKEFRMRKANDIIQATINGAMAITTTAGKIGFPAILAAAPLVTGLVAAQIASIASQKFVGAKGGLIPDISEFGLGGMVYGPSHAQGGVKFNAGGRVVELEGGEAVINKRSTAMFKNTLSSMNVAGGGVKFADGGMVDMVTPGTSNIIQSSSNSNRVALSSDDISQIITGINNKTVTVTESDITSTQNNVNITELTSSIF